MTEPRTRSNSPDNSARLGNLAVGAPKDFLVEEMVMTLRLPAELELKSTKSLGVGMPVRPNLIVRSRRVREGSTLAEAALLISAELTKTMPELSGLGSRAFKFDDDQHGRLISYQFEPAPNTVLFQDHAIRLDDGWLTHATLTTGATTSDETRRGYLEAVTRTHPQKD